MGKKDKKKKKEKDKKKKKEEKKEEVEIAEDIKVEAYSLDTALSSTKKTETTLQTLLKGVVKGDGFVHPKKEEERVTPHLTHESRSKIAEAYVMEDIPIAQRSTDKKQLRQPIIQKAMPSPAPRVKETELEELKEEKVGPPPEVEKKPSFIKKENIYLKLTEFFEELLKSYGERYERWENSISNILAILRKMRKITKKNTEDLERSINNLFEKIQTDLEQFKIKRNEVERVAEVDIESMSGEFKRVLGLLELQVKEYQLKKITDEIIHQQ